ncbi:MAG: UDP-3-O-acyl-N-acetylglucosamine deacetylase [Phycisphaerales bacterium]|jgi:UDP-3-O-acyl-N-acetylglucosamine deacetylase
MPQHRHTLAAPVTIHGTGLFTDQPSAITISPATPGTGIAFEIDSARTAAHINNLSTAPAHPAFAKLPPRCTTIDLRQPDGSARPLFTVEHVLSALVGLGVHDAAISCDGPETPILDGSALDFVTAIQAVGLVRTDTPPERITPRRQVTVEDGRGGSVTIEPIGAEEPPSYTYHLDYGPDSPIAKASVTWDGSADQYAKLVAPARTFCLEAEAEQMHSLGLFKNLTPRDMLVIGPAKGDHPAGPIDNAYRMNDEPAWHKLLDLIGDLALVGTPLHAKVTAHKSGHALHHAAALAVVNALP